MEKREILLFIIILSIIVLINFISAQPYINSSIGLVENSTWQQNLTAVRFSATAFGDIDNDRDLDLALSGCLSAGASDCDNGAISKIYINNGTSLTESQQWQSNLTGAGYGSLAFGDIDNDGDLDLALSGCPNGTETSCANIFSKIYINNGTSFTESNQWQNNLTGVYSVGLTFEDIDNDGKLDLALVGKSNSARIAKIYLNNGSTLIESLQWQGNLTGVRYGMIAFADVDDNGYLDMGLLGADPNNNNYIGFYINNRTSLVYNSTWSSNLAPTNLGSLVFGDYNNDGKIDLIETGIGDYLYTFNNTGSTFIMNQKSSGEGGDLGGGRYEGSTALGDYNNDGDLDFVATGYEEGRSSLYYNNNSLFFIIDKGAGLGIHNDDIHQNALAWGDIDNDGDLDLINVGTKTATGLLAKIYISNATLTRNNTKPNPPNSSFSATYTNNILTLSWGNGSDVETNTFGLYYNLMVGNSSKNHTIVSGLYGGSSGGGNAGGGAAGYFGNMMQRKSIRLNVQLEANKTYNWYVQTIDTGLAKSNWSSMQNFTTAIDITKPNITINYPSPNASLHTTNPYFVFNATVTDANLTNVTLYANWTGSWHINQSNSSGMNGTYVFSVNLTNNVDGHYAWYIGANDSSNNSETSGIRDFYLDRAYPIVRLISPANSASWTSSSTITFSYNVTDTDIANCSLIINNIIDQTDTTITEDTNQTFTKTLSNAIYRWQINCSDYVGFTNSSSIYLLTISYIPPTTYGEGGGGISTTIKTYAITNEELNKGYTQILSKNDKIKFLIANKNHSLTLGNLNTNLSYANLTLNSTFINFLIYVNETRKFELTNDSYYELFVRLNGIENNKANLTIKQIYEEIEVGKKKEKEGEEEKKEEIEEKEKKEKGKISYLKYYFIATVIVIVLAYFIIRNIKTKRRKFKK